MDGNKHWMRFTNFLKQELGQMKKKTLFTFLVLLAVLTACHNGSWEFPDYKYQAVYFAYQYPVRTITLGKSQFSTTLDNKHEFKIMATTGGVYDNKHDVTIDFKVDKSLVKGLLFNQGGDEIQPMPDDYYKLDSHKMVIPKGKLTGGVLVHLTDKFFADSKSLKKTYVIPVKMTKVVNADTMLSGEPKATVSNPRIGHAGDWSKSPKNYTFYAVKYINRWDGNYLSRGKDVISGKNGNSSIDTTIVRHEEHITNNQVVKLNTSSLSQVEFPVTYKDKQGQNINVTLLLNFDDQGNCTISDNSSNYTATGSGKFIEDGAKNSWGGKDRNVIYLDYNVDMSQRTIATKDTLVLRNRGVTMETFSPVTK